MGRHAYLIVAHNNWNILNKQISLIDNEMNDIFLMVDKKSQDFNSSEMYKCIHSKIYLIDRMKLYWADFSLVQAYLNLLEAAFGVEKDSKYTYFHLATGTCLPLKPQSYIHEFCDNSGKEFIGIVPKEFTYCTNRTKVYWLFLNNKLFRKFKPFKAFCYALAYCQKKLGVNRLAKTEYSIYNGWANCSISHDLASYVLEHKETVRSMFDKTLSPDELWIHTIAYNSRFRDRIYDVTDLRKGSMRFIDWERGKPYTWGGEDGDLEKLLNSPYLFARKFDENTNMKIVDQLCDAVKKMAANTR